MYRWIVVFVGLVFLVGCGPSVELRSDPVSISGKLTVGGKPLGDVVFNLHPMEGQHPVPIQVGSDGSFSGKAIPGKYTYYVSAKDANPGALEKVVAKFREADLSRSIIIGADKATFDIALD